MPETFREYPVVEVAILVRGNVPLPSGHERAQEGDIIVSRRPFGWIGRGERTRLLWFLLDGLDWNEIVALDIVNTEPIDSGIIDPNEIVHDKRRYSVPMDRLKEVASFLDLARVRDTTDTYQPFLNLDGDTGEILPSPRASFYIHGLVYDKAFQDFL